MITKENFPIMMAAFCGLLERQQRERLVAQGFNPEIHNHKVRSETGKKYVYIICGSSGKYMIEIKTGNIFGIKGYGQVHKGHFYGTLETVNEYFWGEYYPTRLDGKLGVQKANGCPAITHAPEVDPQPLVPDNGGGNIGPNEDTVCPGGTACGDPICQEERLKRGLLVA